MASPKPVTTVLPPPTIAIAGSMPTSGSPRCIEPPLPPQQPVRLAVQFGHRCAGTHALGKRVSVRAMRGRDPVVTRQHIAHANRHRLLPLVLVQRSRDLTFKKQPVDTLFEPAYKQHPPVQRPPQPAVGRLGAVRMRVRRSLGIDQMITH